MTVPPPPSHLSDGAAAYLVEPDVLDYPAEWSDGPTVDAFREITEPLWASMNDSIGFEFEVHEDTVGGVPVVRISVGSPRRGAAIVHLHGGMYCLGSPTIDHVINAPLARLTGIEVISVDYRLAPEHPFPAALDDALAVHRALTASGITTTLYGESAGGGLAAATALALRDHGDPLPARLALISPMLDLTGSSDTFLTLAPVDPDYADTSVLLEPAAAYAGSEAADHPLLSPLFADLAGLPPTLVQVGNREVLLGDSTRFARRARAAGVRLDLTVLDGGWHNFPIWHGVPEADAAVAELSRFLTEGATT